MIHLRGACVSAAAAYNIANAYRLRFGFRISFAWRCFPCLHPVFERPARGRPPCRSWPRERRRPRTSHAFYSRRRRGRRVFGIERRLAHRMLRAIGSPPLSLVLWNGEEIAESAARPAGPHPVPRPRDVLEGAAGSEPSVRRRLQRRPAGGRRRSGRAVGNGLSLVGRRPAARAASFPPRCSAGCTAPGPTRFPAPARTSTATTTSATTSTGSGSTARWSTAARILPSRR